MPPKDIFSGTQQPINPNALKAAQSGSIRNIDPNLLASLTETVVLYPGPLQGTLRAGQPDQVTVAAVLNDPKYVDGSTFGFTAKFPTIAFTFGGALAGRKFQISFQWHRDPGPFQMTSTPFRLMLATDGKQFADQVQEAGPTISSTVRFPLAGDDLVKLGKESSDCAITLFHDLASGSISNLSFHLL